MVKTGSIQLNTNGNADVQDITPQVAQVVRGAAKSRTAR
jgi:hypothetical protein